MLKFICYITLAAAVAGTACGKRSEVDESWGLNKCVMQEEFRLCVTTISKSTVALPKDTVYQCESAARTLARTKERLIPQECKGY